MKTFAAGVALAALLTSSATAAPQPAGRAATTPAQAMGHGQVAMRDYMQAMQSMHQSMMRMNDADPDRAFAFKMIEHHRGGIAMADVLMKHGDDAELKQMAQKTRSEQMREIGELQAWLDRHGGRTARP